MIKDKNDIDFEKSIRDLLEDFSDTPPADCWTEISVSLSKRKSLRRRRVFYYSVTSAAAVVLLFFGIFQINNTDIVLSNRESISVISPPVIANSEIVHSTKRAQAILKIGQRASRSDLLSVNETNLSQIEEQKDENLSTIIGIIEEPKDSLFIINKDNESIDNKMSVEQYLFIEGLNSRSSTRRSPYLALSTNLSPSSSRNSVSLIAVNQTPGEYTMSNLVSAEHKSTVIHEVVSNTKFLMPLSFGAQLQIPINSKFSLGTGLFYTMLFSHYDVISRNETRETQQTLHYIGIPLNLFYNIYYGNGFRLYLTAGGALEKGVGANFRVLENGVRHSYSKSIDGVQWSIMGGVGAEFDVSERVGLYFDPSISYFFESDQPISIRTSQPLQYRFELGFRFKL